MHDFLAMYNRTINLKLNFIIIPFTAKDAKWCPRGITHLRIFYRLAKTFIMRFNSQYANSEKVMPLWGRLLGSPCPSCLLCAYVANCTRKYFAVEECYYAMEISLVLH